MRTQLAGRVAKFHVKQGQFVEDGAVLLQLVDDQYRHAVAQAAAEVELAEALLQRRLNGARAEDRAEAAALHRAKPTPA